MDLIVGYGEVGKGLHKLIPGATPLDMGDTYEGAVEAMHICIPYTDSFVKNVKDYIKKYQPKLTIIHSTVPVGTTRKIGDVAYSFVRGKHPHLEEMVNYVKHVSAERTETALKAVAYLKEKGFQTKLHGQLEAVEFGKLFDTTYYGVCIAAIKEFKKMADYYGIDWHNIAEINHTYNIGVEPKFVRPELEPMDGEIGGHCVVPNAKILQKDFKSKLLDAIVEAK